MKECKNIVDDKKSLAELVTKVTFEYHKYLNERMERYFNTTEKRIGHLKGISEVLMAILLDDEKLKQKTIQKALEAHKKISDSLTKKDLEEAFGVLMGYFKRFLKEKNMYYCIDDNIERFKKYKEEFLKANEEVLNNEQEDGFFELDSEERDNNIEQMHYEEHQKISAKEFMAEDSIDEDIIYELEELLNEYNDLSFTELNEEYLEKLKNILEGFVRIFNYSVEFRDLAYAMEKLLDLLNRLEIKENKELIKLLLDTVIADLNKFFYAVFINKEAVDIHYLDASLLANIAQIEIILNQN